VSTNDDQQPRADKQKLARRRERNRRAWELNVAGRSHRQIAQQLESEGFGPISHVAVGKALRRIADRTAQELADVARREAVRQLASLDYVIQQAWEAWRASIGESKRVTQRTVAPPAIKTRGRKAKAPGGRKETTVEVRQINGDPRYLEQIRGCLADRRKILGIDAPTEVEIGGRSAAEPIPLRLDLAGVPTEQLEQILAALDLIRRFTAQHGDASRN
jgi:hypothetical protein